MCHFPESPLKIRVNCREFESPIQTTAEFQFTKGTWQPTRNVWMSLMVGSGIK